MKSNFIKGFIATIPVGLSVCAYGLVLGVLAFSKGVTFFQLFSMDLITFAGSAQFLMVELWKNPLPFSEILFAVFAINLRYLLIGASLTPLFKNSSIFEKIALMHLVADENWAVTMSRLKEEKITPYFLFGGGICLVIFWLLSTLGGHTFGFIISDPYSVGLDFVIIIIFTALVASFYDGKDSIFPWIIAAVFSYFSFLFIPGKWYIVTGGLTGALVYSFQKYFKEGKK
ncbi:MAG: AzlC family ABC transporter permease [Candidatus Methanofastidiosa archaeon]|mgnify:FL=1|jgi:predicted branched-subunit amino acid permease|nr:AzlC family ABC transporter permease [Candidatus Methanofastidiosa archaeon]HOM95853.1 AzlC family ABC transporter permease [Methanofastidiosum sp.]HPC80967.1 AzlC family ABC transporter permease [Methanofastidiosum sp.]HRS25520.1 AzlC family ABC transporter permease [Methanofastidiosum sp.]